MDKNVLKAVHAMDAWASAIEKHADKIHKALHDAGYGCDHLKYLIHAFNEIRKAGMDMTAAMDRFVNGMEMLGLSMARLEGQLGPKFKRYVRSRPPVRLEHAEGEIHWPENVSGGAEDVMETDKGKLN